MDTAVVAATIAAVAGFVSAGVAYGSGKKTREALDRRRSEDHQIRQLSELYGPMHVLRKESKSLWKQLPPDPDPEPGVTQWKLIDHIEEIWGEAGDRRRMVVGRILEINDQLRELIVGQGGLLVEFPAPESFETFLTHCSTLRQHWERHVNVTDPASYVPFPGDIDDDIESAIMLLRKGLPAADV